MTTAFVAALPRVRRRPFFSVAVYAASASLLVLHAAVSIAVMPFTLAFDRDRRFPARLGSWLARSALRVPPRWRDVARRIASIETGRPGRPVIIVMNHRSLADVAIAVAVPGGPKIVSKPWAGRLPLLGWCMRLSGHVIFDPRSPRSVRELMSRAEGLLARGNSVLFFPEGTRRSASGLGVFHLGAFRLAVKMGADVLPVVLVGTGELVPRGSLAFHEAHVGVVVLPRVVPGSDRRVLARRVRTLMAASLVAHR